MSRLSNVVSALQTTFGPAAERANEQAQAVKRRRKLTPVTLAQSFIMALLAKPKADSEDVAKMAASLGIEISPQAMEQRYSTKLMEFFKALFEEMLSTVVKSEQALAPVLARFTEVKLIDSSVIALPNSIAEQYPGCGGSRGYTSAALKLQTELDLRSGQVQNIQIEPGKLPDQGTDRQHLKPVKGSLRITDLGYFNLSVFAMIAAEQAYYLSRTQYTVSVKINGSRYGLIAWLTQQGNETVDQWIEVGTQNVLKCRLIAWRVPPEIAKRRRQKMRQSMKDRGRQPTEAALASCDWEYLITNLDTEQLSFKEAIVLYRSRWQIELLFKRWKTHCQIDLLDGRTDEITMTRLWIRLCGAIVQHWIIVGIAWVSSQKISFDKLAKLIGESTRELGHTIGDTVALIKVLEIIARQAAVGCRRTKSKHRPSTTDLLNDADLLEYSLPFGLT